MKKILLVILVTITFLTGCDNSEELKKQMCKLNAVNYAVDCLNDVIGYDGDMSHTMQCRLKSKKEIYPQLFQVYENDKLVLSLIIEDDQQGTVSGERSFRYNGHDLVVNRVSDQKEISQYKVLVDTVDINEYLYLENISGISIDNSYFTTSSSATEIIKEFLASQLPSFGVKENDEISVYEHLNIIDVSFDQSDNRIISKTDRQWYYPFSINGQLKGLLLISNDFQQVLGAVETDNEQWQPYLENGKAFLIINGLDGIVLPAEGDVEIAAPVVVKKAYSIIKSIAQSRPACKVILTYIYQQ